MEVSEFHCVLNLDRFGGLGYNGVAAVLLECYTYIPTCYAMEIPGVSCTRIFVGDKVTS